MTMYWPLATVIDENGNEINMSCYNQVESLEKCFEVFDVWEKEYKYKIKTAHVQVIEEGKPLVNRHFEKRWIEVGEIQHGFRFTEDERDEIVKYQRILGVDSPRSAVMNAIRIAMDDENEANEIADSTHTDYDPLWD